MPFQDFRFYYQNKPAHLSNFEGKERKVYVLFFNEFQATIEQFCIHKVICLWSKFETLPLKSNFSCRIPFIGIKMSKPFINTLWSKLLSWQVLCFQVLSHIKRGWYLAHSAWCFFEYLDLQNIKNNNELVNWVKIQ